jgi:hypothetical protein
LEKGTIEVIAVSTTGSRRLRQEFCASFYISAPAASSAIKPSMPDDLGLGCAAFQENGYFETY